MNHYPKIIEHYASRNFIINARVKAFFKERWYKGKVVNKYFKENNDIPFIMVLTDDRVDDESSYLNGFGLEYIVNSPRIIFEREEFLGDDLFTKTYLRDMTPKEKEDYDNVPF